MEIWSKKIKMGRKTGNWVEQKWNWVEITKLGRVDHVGQNKYFITYSAL